MLFLTTYRVKPYLPRSEVEKLLDLFGKAGAAPGNHRPLCCGRQFGRMGCRRNEDAVTGYEASLLYSEYIEFDTKPVLTIEDALPSLLEAYQ